MAVATFTKSGTKATTPATLDKKIFGLKVTNHELLRDAYLAYLAEARNSGAKTKKRGEVRGGGRKPWRQKGTGNARFGSSRNPIWRGGGVAFGPTGNENHIKKLNLKAKRQALRQALSLAAAEDRIKVIESFSVADGKTRSAVQLIKKLGAEGTVLVVVESKDELTQKSTNNLANIKLAQANYLNVFDVMNADHIVICRSSLELVQKWLAPGTKTATVKEAVK
jgi:large subunit ribosomal protein L4